MLLWGFLTLAAVFAGESMWIQREIDTHAWLIRPVPYQMWRPRHVRLSEKSAPRSVLRVARVNVACAECEQKMTQPVTPSNEQRATSSVQPATPSTEQRIPSNERPTVNGERPTEQPPIDHHPAAPTLEPDFPSFDHAVSPVSRIPNWGVMTTPEEWEKPYREMDKDAYVSVPRYDIASLTIPMLTLLKHRDENVALITAKLYYSTRHFAAYHLDAGEFSGVHPGMDLKLPLGTPVGSIGGGRVHRVTRDENLGIHIIVEHHVPEVGIFFSIYGHLGETWVSEGDAVTPGQTIGTVGMTGNTSNPHLHLQIDTDTGARPHVRYWPSGIPSSGVAAQFTMHPLGFIGKY